MNGRETPSKRFVIRGGRVIDPARNFDRTEDIGVDGDRISAASESDAAPAAGEIDARGLIVCPGLIDMHVHLREPGAEHKETIETGTGAAVAGGFTAVACMPNTKPAIDNIATLQHVIERARQIGVCRVHPIGAITVNRQGTEVVDMTALKQHGAVAFSDDGDGVENDSVMREAFARARERDAAIIQHCEYKAISAGGVMHKGRVSDALGLPGLDPRSEEDMIERDIALVRETGARYHVAHISTARAVELVRRAKADGLPVTTEVCPHHLLLTDDACSEQDPNTKMHPPLRTAEDVAACRRGFLDGTIDCIATDHAPHTAEEKARGFLKAPPGIVGLETALALTCEALSEDGSIDWCGLIRSMTVAPASVLGVTTPSLTPTAPADITLIDPRKSWRIAPETFHGKTRNTPFGGRDVVGRAVATIVGGRLRHQLADEAHRFERLSPIN